MRRASLLVVLALCACSSPDPTLASCPATSAEALVDASAVESYLGLSQAETRAIVRVTNDAGPDAPLCSGVFIAPDWVVTAAHCLVIDSAQVVVPGGDEGTQGAVLPVIDELAHPVVDVALLRVGAAVTDLGVTPVGLPAP